MTRVVRVEIDAKCPLDRAVAFVMLDRDHSIRLLEEETVCRVCHIPSS
ncbi:hypothetical protein [Halofilum ochraceum]|nr:hypothetical protein [Halofilum ochraceum]